MATEVKLVRATSLDGAQVAINQHLHDGWRLVGPVQRSGAYYVMTFERDVR